MQTNTVRFVCVLVMDTNDLKCLFQEHLGKIPISFALLCPIEYWQ